MFLGFGAYGAAVMAGVLGIKIVRAVLLGVGALSRMVAAVPIGLVCVRYTGIFFGMLTLAFGMLFSLVPVQVLPPDRRRQRHARAAHEHPRAGVRAVQQDRVPGRAVLLLLPGAAGDRRAR